MKKELQNILAYFSKRREVVTLFLFGTFATPNERRHSDIDLAVLLDPWELKERNVEVFKDEYYRASPDFPLRSVDFAGRPAGRRPVSRHFPGAPGRQA